jgi:osmotically-inducible protein OsmY
MTTLADDLGQRVANALMEDPRTGEALIDVANDRGIVTLTGTVESDEVRTAAEVIARKQHGVVTVVNELKVE